MAVPPGTLAVNAMGRELPDGKAAVGTLYVGKLVAQSLVQFTLAPLIVIGFVAGPVITQPVGRMMVSVSTLVSPEPLLMIEPLNDAVPPAGRTRSCWPGWRR